ncbi:MAG: Zn-ribbon domain-containing OB-fold protein [Thaumarchaeota archaeon]|nr:Zn-ribbon domain-containing OB-fold protein [Nitrososphaerota archaeon]
MPEVLTVDSFYDFGRKGILMGLTCGSGHVTVPPRASCRICGSTGLITTQLSGKGRIVSFTEVFVKSKEFPLDTPYTLALVQLVEGGSLLGVIDSTSITDVVHDAKVRIEFRQLGEEKTGWPRIFFVSDS